MKILCKTICFLIFLNLGMGLTGKTAGQIEITKANNPSPIEYDTVFIDDDFDVNTPGWGVYCFDIIQDGITAVDMDGTVFVYNGTYYENIVISKPIDLVGESKDSTICDGGNNGDVITVSSDSVHISALTILNGNEYGIIVNSGYNKISGSNFMSNYQNSIRILNVSGNIIINNYFSNSSHGIKIADSDSNRIENNTISDSYISLLFGNYNEIIGNTTRSIGITGWYNIITANIISLSSGTAFYLDHGEYNVITGNILTNNGSGFDLHASNNNTITNNTISGNSGTGIYLPDCMCGGCNNNDIYHNNWINNGYHGYDQCTNNWDDGYPSGGNFWDDYPGVDNFSGPNQNIPGGDSIGDTPYLIQGGNEKDFYPLMLPYGMSSLATLVYVDDDFDENTPGWGYDHFNSLQLGVNLVATGGTVYIAEGIYFENVNINKKVSVIGVNADSTIIDGGGSGTMVYITADSVFISGITIQNSGESGNGFYIFETSACKIIGNKVINCYNGIISKDSEKTQIIDNIVIQCNNGGIWLSSANNCLVSRNTSQSNRLGLGVSYSSNNSISGNKISENSWDGGILMYYSSYNMIISNKIINNDDHGIYIRDYCSNNIIKGNKISANTPYGIKIILSSNNNSIYHNILEDNSTANAYDECSNAWHNGYVIPFDPWFGGGNYYGDYSGTDDFSGPWQNTPGSDGIGDDAYTIAGNSGNYDSYPFMNENGWHIRLQENTLADGGYIPDNIGLILNDKKDQSSENSVVPDNSLFFKISPNPGKNFLHITSTETDRHFTFNLYDLQGSEVYSVFNCNSNFRVNTSLLPVGLYFYHISTDKGYRQTGKWIKE